MVENKNTIDWLRRIVQAPWQVSLSNAVMTTAYTLYDSLMISHLQIY